MIEIITGLAGPFIKELIIGALGLVAVALFGWRQKRKGRAEILEANRRARVEAREQSGEIEDAVAGRDDAEIDKELEKWSK